MLHCNHWEFSSGGLFCPQMQNALEPQEKAYIAVEETLEYKLEESTIYIQVEVQRIVLFGFDALQLRSTGNGWATDATIFDRDGNLVDKTRSSVAERG